MTTASKKPVHKDTQRLKTLIDLQETGSCDFAETLFHARNVTKTELAAYRKALDEYHRSHG